MQQRYSFDWRGVSLPVHKASLEYIGGVSSQLQWQARDDRFHETNQDILKQIDEQNKKAEAFLSSAEGQKKLGDFLGESSQLFSSFMLGNQEGVLPYIQGKDLCFVIGAMRTGGTYLYRELCRMSGVDHTQYLKTMTHDAIPSGHALAFWQDPRHWMQLVFEMAQFLVWSKREQADHKELIQKRIAYGHAMGFLDNLFAPYTDRLVYVVSLRHPLTMADSFAKLEGIDPTQKNPASPPSWFLLAQKNLNLNQGQWQDMNFYEQCLCYWDLFYRDVVRFGGMRGKMVTLVYGKEYEQFLMRLAMQSGRDSYEPKPFIVENKERKPEYQSVNDQAVIENLKGFWLQQGYHLPKIPLR